MNSNHCLENLQESTVKNFSYSLYTLLYYSLITVVYSMVMDFYTRTSARELKRSLNEVVEKKKTLRVEVSSDYTV